MKQLASAILLALSAGTALALPPAVELDRLMLHAKTALEAGAYAEAADNLAKAQKLGIALPENYALSYATALNGQGKTKEAKAALEKYLNSYGTKGTSYKAVLALLVEIEGQEQGGAKASPQPASSESKSQTSALPARPQLPFFVSEAVWQAMETSEAYRTAPRPRAYSIRYQANDQFEYTGAKSSSLPRPAPSSKSLNTLATPLTDKCWLQHSTLFNSITGGNYTSDSFICGGFLSLGSTDNNNGTGVIQSLDELKGSLFPLRVGNQMSLRYETAYQLQGRTNNTTIASSCQITGQGPAADLHPALKGTAWKMHCQNSIGTAGSATPIVNEIDDYYLEELGLRLSVIGQLDFRNKQFILPKPGDQTVLIVEGEYGSRITTTYTSYDWSVDTKPQSMASATGSRP